MTEWIDACALDDLEEEGVRRFDHGGRTFAIYRMTGDEVFCTDGLCSHEAVHLSDGLVMDYQIECPKHSGVFDIRTGEVKWSEAGFGPGPVILTGDTVIAVSDKGEIVASEAKPEKYTELKRDDVLDGKVWGYPVIAYDHLFVRSTKEGVCLEIK